MPMTTLLPPASLLLHAVLVLAAALLLPGLLEVAESVLSGLPPPSPLLPVRELRRLLAREPGREEGASPLFAAAPAGSLVLAGVAALLVPSFALGMPGGVGGDLLLVLALLLLSRLLPVLAALDGGAAVAGGGAATLAGLGALAVPAALPAVLALSLPGGGTGLDALSLAAGGRAPAPALLAAAALALALLVAEGGPARGAARPPPPAAAVLEPLSGRDLALVRLAGWLRRAVALGLLGTVALPFGMAAAAGGPLWPLDWLLGAACWALRLVLATLVLAAMRALLPAPRSWGLLGVAAGLGLVAALLELLGQAAA